MKEDKIYKNNHNFSMEELMDILNDAVGKTLGEIDKSHVFDRAIKNPKITGIAGDVIEQSVLGYSANSDQNPDILVDGIPVEVKTTGIRYSKKDKNSYEAKEPMSITAVSPKTIVNEEFEYSHFWNKLANMLIVYYLYGSDETVHAIDYADFYLKGFDMHKFNETDKMILKHDWTTVRNFIKDIQNNYSTPEEQYYRLSSELRDRLMYIDTAPKWPNPPRFRLKRSFVTNIVQHHFNNIELDDVLFSSYSEVDKKCNELTKKYSGKTISDLIDIFDLHIDKTKNLDKAISEQIIVKMFGGNVSKINKIDIFNKSGLIGKSIVLTSKGARTEDMKLFKIDFDELEDETIKFEDSTVYDYFANHQFICAVFKEKDEQQHFIDNMFVGFKRLTFTDEFIMNDVLSTWRELKRLITTKALVEKVVLNKDGNPIVNKNGIIKTTINFPKSRDYEVFVRGSGIDSSSKPLTLCGIKMYAQYMWIKGKLIVSQLEKIDLL